MTEFALRLNKLGVELVSTGGTAKTLRGAELPVRDVSDLTGFPEMLSGRVKTLHPKVHGGILALRDSAEHRREAAQHGIELIDLVAANLYPFQATIDREGIDLEEAIENIDIGGPSMIRSAAKNFRDVAVLVDPADYQLIAEEMESSRCQISQETRIRLARKAFDLTARYDASISSFLNNRVDELGNIREPAGAELPARFTLLAEKAFDLRYGENPHQRAALYVSDSIGGGVANAEKIQGKELSYNNLIDLHAAWSLASELGESDREACVIIKHTNPCGAARGVDACDAFQKARATDPVSAFGGIVGFSSTVGEDSARAISETFFEAVIAPDYTPGALDVLSSKKNLRLIRVSSEENRAPVLDIRVIGGGLLLQDKDRGRFADAVTSVVTRRGPTSEEMEALKFAWTIVKHVKSNAIVYARAGQLVGVGAGQMSRVDSVKIAAMKSVLSLENAVMASDAFFPFRDGVDEAARAGITAVIQPGGSVRDEEVIGAANEHNLAMVFTGMRHFKH